MTLVSVYREKFSRFGIKEKIRQEFMMNYSEEDNGEASSSWTWPPYSKGKKDRYYYRSVLFRTVNGFMYQHSIKLGGQTEEYYAITTGNSNERYSRGDAYTYCFNHVIYYLIRDNVRWITVPDNRLLF